MANKSIIIDGIELRLVPRQSTDGSLFYVSGDQSDVVGYKLYPDGRQEKVNATPTTCSNCKVKSNAGRKQRYLQFKEVLGHHKHILASHAVYLAWSEEGYIPEGFEIDHLNGITTDNCILNLEAVSKPENRRRQACSNKMKAAALMPKLIFYRNLRGIFHLKPEQFEHFLAALQLAMRYNVGDPLNIANINIEVAIILDQMGCKGVLPNPCKSKITNN